jgi:uncharacterized damage-inducible protein DinB
MGRAIDVIRFLLDEAFGGEGIVETNESQSLLANLATVDDGQWTAVPAHGRRSIASIALHVGSCKVMYDEYAFGNGALSWDDPAVVPWEADVAPRDGTVAWLRATHDRLMEHVAALGDDDLVAPRQTNWGELRETRWLLSTLMQHDAYHAGEINNIRALLGGDDAWRWG